jgi:predicted nucleic acid-binding protein
MSESETNASLSFIDTNIWLYAFIESQHPDKSAVARSLIRTQALAVSTQVINEVCVNLIKKARFTEAQVQELITSFYRRYGVVEPGQADLLKASELREKHRFSFWDSMMVASALHAGARTLYSEDMQDALVVEGRLKIVNPFSHT